MNFTTTSDATPSRANKQLATASSSCQPLSTNPTPSHRPAAPSGISSAQQQHDQSIKKGTKPATQTREKGGGDATAVTGTSTTSTGSKKTSAQVPTLKPLTAAAPSGQTRAQPLRTVPASAATTLSHQAPPSGMSQNGASASTTAASISAGTNAAGTVSQPPNPTSTSPPILALASTDARTLPVSRLPSGSGVPQNSSSLPPQPSNHPGQDSTTAVQLLNLSAPAPRLPQASTLASTRSANPPAIRTASRSEQSLSDFLSGNRASVLDQSFLRLPQPPPLFPTTLSSQSTATSSTFHRPAAGQQAPSHIDSIESLEVLEGVAQAKQSEILDLQVRQANVNMQLDNAQQDYARLQRRMHDLRQQRQLFSGHQREEIAPTARTNDERDDFSLSLLMDYSNPNRMEGPSTRPPKR